MRHTVFLFIVFGCGGCVHPMCLVPIPCAPVVRMPAETPQVQTCPPGYRPILVDNYWQCYAETTSYTSSDSRIKQFTGTVDATKIKPDPTGTNAVLLIQSIKAGLSRIGLSINDRNWPTTIQSDTVTVTTSDERIGALSYRYRIAASILSTDNSVSFKVSSYAFYQGRWVEAPNDSPKQFFDRLKSALSRIRTR